jgi:large subunit ribosomal protein L3
MHMDDGIEVASPATVVETPKMEVIDLRTYRMTQYGMKVVGVDGDDKIDEVRILTRTQPDHVSGVPSKMPELMEMGIGGGVDASMEYANSLIGKSIGVADVFREGQLIDISAITKGEGRQGPVKRWGVTIQDRKAQRSSKGRHVGTLGPWHPARLRWTVPQEGQMGYHQRTEYNKCILKIGGDGEKITPKGGFKGYGIVRNEYVLLSGSIPGPRKRLIRMRDAIRA